MLAASPEPVTVQVSVMSQDAKKLNASARPFGDAMGTRANKMLSATAILIFMMPSSASSSTWISSRR